MFLNVITYFNMLIIYDVKSYNAFYALIPYMTSICANDCVIYSLY